VTQVNAVIRPDRCERCKFASPSEGNAPLLDCHRFPPQIQAFPVRDTKTGNMAFQELTFQPKVHPANHCGEHKPRIEGMN
jgi:hypothetical protein